MVNVSDVLVLMAICVAPKAFAIVGGRSTTKLTEALSPVPPSLEVTGPVVLVFAPPVVDATFTPNRHPESPASVAPAKPIVLVPGTAVIVPPPHPPTPFGFKMTSPEGSVSVKATPVREEALGLLRIKMMPNDSLTGMRGGMPGGPTNCVEIVGGSVAEATLGSKSMNADALARSR